MSESSSHSLARLVSRVLAGATDIRPGEGRAVLASGLLFFLVLAAIMVLRPVREAMGLVRGIEGVRTLFLFTVGVTLLLVPAFGYLVSRLRRRVFLAISFRCCALILLCFYLSLTILPTLIPRVLPELGSVALPEPTSQALAQRSSTALPAQVSQVVKQIYYVFHSVFNLFVVSLFWAFMADVFGVSESKRLFPAIAVGGTLGAIAGAMISWQLAGPIGTAAMFLVAAGLLELAVWTTALVARARGTNSGKPADTRPIGGHALAGATALLRSPYLLGIVLLILPGAVISTLFYFTGMRIVEAACKSIDERTVLFAQIDLWAQVGTLVAQAFLAGRIMRWLGVGTALAVLPLTAVVGFAVLALLPALTAYVVVNTIFRAVQRGIARPARETLFTVVGREEKYKAKSLLDTVGFRAGDATGAQLERALDRLGLGVNGLAMVVMPIALFWIVLALLLGRAQSRLAERKPPESA